MHFLPYSLQRPRIPFYWYTHFTEHLQFLYFPTSSWPDRIDRFQVRHVAPLQRRPAPPWWAESNFPLQIGWRFDWPLQFIVNAFFWIACLCSVLRLQVVRRFFFFLEKCRLWERFLHLFLDRSRTLLHRLCRSSSHGGDMHDIRYGSPTTTPTSTLDRDELGAALLFWKSSSDKCLCEHADRCQFLKRGPGASEG